MGSDTAAAAGTPPYRDRRTADGRDQNHRAPVQSLRRSHAARGGATPPFPEGPSGFTNLRDSPERNRNLGYFGDHPEDFGRTGGFAPPECFPLKSALKSQQAGHAHVPQGSREMRRRGRR